MLNHAQIDDFVEATLARYDRGKWVDITPDYQDLEFVARNFKNKQVTEKGGARLEWKVQVDKTDNFRLSGMYDPDRSEVKNVLKPARVEWSKQTTNFTYDVDEPEFQGGFEEIIDLLEVKEHDMWTGWFEGMEEMLWTAPTSDGPPQPLYGIPFWVQKNDSDTPGFNGGNPTGYSSGAAGLSSDTYTRWKNWTFTYDEITRLDLVEKVMEAMAWTNFKSPHNFNELGALKMPDWMLYSTWEVVSTVTGLLEQNNDNLGREVGFMKGMGPLFKGSPLKWIPALDGGRDRDGVAKDTSNPVYGINWRLFQLVFQKGKKQTRSKPIMSSESHSVRTVHVDNWAQYRCLRRDGNFVGYVAA